LPDRFDAMVRILSRSSRRQALKLLFGAALGSQARDYRPLEASARRRCRNGPQACRAASCGGKKKCLPDLRAGEGQDDRICCCPNSIFVLDTDYSNEACCPNDFVCRPYPGHPQRDQCCDPSKFACLPGVGCCPKEYSCCTENACEPGRECCVDTASTLAARATTPAAMGSAASATELFGSGVPCRLVRQRIGHPPAPRSSVDRGRFRDGPVEGQCLPR
jgi:hypothetical protein